MCVWPRRSTYLHHAPPEKNPSMLRHRNECFKCGPLNNFVVAPSGLSWSVPFLSDLETEFLIPYQPNSKVRLESPPRDVAQLSAIIPFICYLRPVGSSWIDEMDQPAQETSKTVVIRAGEATIYM